MQIEATIDKLSDPCFKITITHGPISIEFAMDARKAGALLKFGKSQEDELFVFDRDSENGMALYKEDDKYILRSEDSTNINIILTESKLGQLQKEVKTLRKQVKALSEA